MAEFRVTHTFALEARSLFVLAGAVVSGEVRSGMLVRIPFNSSVAMTAPIEAIEFVRQPGGAEEVCLCIRYADTDELSVWRGLNIGDETFEVVADTSAQASAEAGGRETAVVSLPPALAARA